MFWSNRPPPIHDWAKAFDAFERGTITNHEAHTLMDRIRELEWEHLNERLLEKVKA